jgi:hypothetical protein
MGAAASNDRQQNRIPRELCVPHGKFSLEYVDLKKLRRLVRSQKLAPCYPPRSVFAPGEVRAGWLIDPVIMSTL